MTTKRKKRSTNTMSSAGKRSGGHERLGGEHPINLLCQPFLPFDNEQKEKPTEDELSVLFVSVFCQHRADDIGSNGLVRVGEKNSKIVEK